MARILLLTPQMPYPPQQGTSLRNFHILKGILINHEVDLFTLHKHGKSAQLPPELSGCTQVRVVPPPIRTMNDRFITLLSDRKPDIAHRLHSRAFDLELTNMLTDGRASDGDLYDVVQIEGLEMAEAIPTVRQLSPASRIVFDSHNAETELQRRAFKADLSNPSRWPAAIYSVIQQSRLKQYEGWACRSADWITVVSNQDRKHLNEFATDSRITVIPNCIDVAKYAIDPGHTSFDYDLVFTGKMDYRPNVDAVIWFAGEIWPSIKQNHPEVRLAIVGQRPHQRLQSLASRPGITITGWVEEVVPYIAGASVVIMPFRVGSGTRLKLIEAMAAGKAVVSTRVGAEGFDVQDGKQLILADRPGEFARSVSFLLESSSERRRLGAAAQQFTQQYDWRKIVPKFDEIYEKLLG